MGLFGGSKSTTQQEVKNIDETNVLTPRLDDADINAPVLAGQQLAEGANQYLKVEQTDFDAVDRAFDAFDRSADLSRYSISDSLDFGVESLRSAERTNQDAFDYGVDLNRQAFDTIDETVYQSYGAINDAQRNAFGAIDDTVYRSLNAVGESQRQTGNIIDDAFAFLTSALGQTASFTRDLVTDLGSQQSATTQAVTQATRSDAANSIDNLIKNATIIAGIAATAFVLPKLLKR